MSQNIVGHFYILLWFEICKPAQFLAILTSYPVRSRNYVTCESHRDGRFDEFQQWMNVALWTGAGEVKFQGVML